MSYHEWPTGIDFAQLVIFSSQKDIQTGFLAMGKCISCFVSTPDSADHQYVEPVCAGGTEVVTNETSNKADLQNLMNEQTRMISSPDMEDLELFLSHMAIVMETAQTRGILLDQF